MDKRDNTSNEERSATNERSREKKDPSLEPRTDADRAMNKPNSSPKTAASAGLGQTGQSGERSPGANPEQGRTASEQRSSGQKASLDQPAGTPATQPPLRTVDTQPGEPYNDDTDLRH